MAEQLGLINSMEMQAGEEGSKSLFFDDGERRIDYVLAYVDEEEEEDRQKNSAKRELFLRNLKGQGLELEEAISSKVSRLGHKFVIASPLILGGAYPVSCFVRQFEVCFGVVLKEGVAL